MNLGEEKKLWKKGYRVIIGVDEAGRGPLAGPVVAAAAMVKNPNSQFPISNQIPNPKSQESKLQLKSQIFREVKDSKKLSPKKREELYKIITKNPMIKWGIGRVSEKVIDKINIKNAAELAMEKALKNLEKKMKNKVDFLVIDGNALKNPRLKKFNHKLIVKADEKVFSCAAASILAKVSRDRIMMRCHKKYPRYGFDKHKGYPTKYHIMKLKKYGPCEIHRKSFKPIKK